MTGAFAAAAALPVSELSAVAWSPFSLPVAAAAAVAAAAVAVVAAVVAVAAAVVAVAAARAAGIVPSPLFCMHPVAAAALFVWPLVFVRAAETQTPPGK